jgi:hypothetical protein
MSEESNSESGRPPPSGDRRLEMDFRSAEFPSDHLSIKRLRKIFPQHFDGPDRIADGYTNNDFFFPAGEEEPPHLVRLTELICDERTVASGAYYRQFSARWPDVLDAEDVHCIEHSKARLVLNYQFFKLADSPESARLLIRQIEEVAERQAERDQSRRR